MSSLSITTWIFWLTFIAVSVGVLSGCEDAETPEHRAEAARQKWQQEVGIFAAKNDAVADWAAKLPNRGYGRGPFTADISSALMPPPSITGITPNVRPVLLRMHLRDVIAEKDGFGYKLVFIDNIYGGDLGSFRLTVELKWNRLGPPKQFLQTKPDDHAASALVARIEEVTRLPDCASAGDSERDVDVSSRSFVAKGALLEVMPQSPNSSSELDPLD